ncbi:MAG TPA: cysteine hydrolase [Pyrodictium sp.]|nr:cysteine hydrolase [Pyrodictium sp.]HIQ55923.1 cysteine hydrolase [Pyrodictium sp.]
MRSFKPSIESLEALPILDRVKLDARRTAVIVVDMQNEFANPKGKLYLPSTQQIIHSIRSLLSKARQKKATIVYTMDTHYPDDLEFKDWGQHAVKNSWGWRIIDELKPEHNDIVVEKSRFDAFYNTMLDDILRTRGIENLVIVGTVANICVLATIAGAYMRGYRVYVPINAVAYIDELSLYIALYQASKVYRATLVEKAENVEFE